MRQFSNYHFSFISFSEYFSPLNLYLCFFLDKCADLADRRMMNRRFYMPYDDYFLNHYDEYQPSHQSHSNGAHNDIYGRMYSDRNHGEYFVKNIRVDD